MRRSNDVDGRSPSPSRTRLDTAPVDWAAVTQSLINVALAEERRFNRKVLAGGSSLKWMTISNAPCGR